MNRLPLQWALAALFSLALVLSACGKDESDACADIDCKTGECSKGVCLNPSSCGADDQCLDGFFCNTDQVCEASVPCNAGTPCPAGECNFGACINPQQCDADDQCLPGFECGSEGTCVVSPCANVTCDRGICNADSGECVNQEFCTDETELDACLDGFYCYGRECTPEATICDDLDCQRGVCDPAQKACANAESCTTDQECLDNSYCTSEGTCGDNRCDDTMTTCARGVCDPETTECVNAATCNDLSDCTDGFYCIDSACIAIDQACGTDGCPGNQICDFDEPRGIAFCDENPNGCTQALDCNSPRVCDLGRCAAPAPCTPDALEPNNVFAEATAFQTVANNGVLDATLCPADTDVYTFNTRDTALFTGTLVIDVRTAPIDLGIGNINVRVLSQDGTEVGNETAYDPSPIIVDVGALLAGTFTIEVTSPDVTTAGVRYSLSVNFYDDTTAIACQSPVMLTPDSGPFNTSTTQAQSFELGSSCTSETNPAGERIFAFEITETVYTEIVVDPAAGIDVTVSLREECLSGASEVACAARGAVSANETIGTVLVPGTYYAIVQGPDENTATGSFSIDVTTQPTICVPGEATCLSDTQSQVCNGRGTGYDDVTCTNGCDMANGLCVRDPSDVCYTAIDATGGYSGQVAWGMLSSDYNPTPPNCIPRTSSGSESSGPDAVFTVDLNPDEVLIVDLTASGEQVSLYAVTNCGTLENSCVAAANASTSGDEQLVYFNTSGSQETLYIIADVLQSVGYFPSDITIQQLPVICSPGDQVCSGDDSLTCNATGTAQTATPCPFGCANGVCNQPPNDSCATAIDLITAGSYSAPIGPYNNTYSPSSLGCTGSTATGGDAVFDVTGTVGEVVTVDVSATFDAALSIVTDCSDLTGSCVAGAAESTFGQVEFLVEPGQTYYAIVDSDFSDTGDYTIRAQSQVPSCVPGTILGCVGGTELEYCSPLGVPTLYSCDGSCSNNACDAPRGTVCIDAIDASNGFSITGQDFDTANNFDSGTGTLGACTFTTSDDTVGADRVHRVDLLPGDVLIAEMSSGSSFGTMYLLESCGDFNSCIERTPPASGASHSITYTATATETVYLYTDRTTTGTSTLDYDLDIRVTKPCVPGQPAYCDADGQTVVYCDSDALENTYTCPTTCTSGLCDNPTGESCFDPIQVSTSGPVTGDFDGTDDVNYGIGRFGGCHIDDFDAPDGAEEVYAIDLGAGDTLVADLQTTFSTAQLFILQDCINSATCQTNNPGQGATTLSYRATTPETIYVVVDASSTSTSATYTLDLQITPGLICAPNTWACDPSGSPALCNGSGTAYARTTFCSTTCTNGFCAEDDTNSDVCTTAPDASAGTRIATTFDNLTNDISLPVASCVGDDTPGPDYIQSVVVNADDIIRATVESYGFEETAVYIFTDCADAAGTCVAGDQGESTEGYRGEVVFRAPTAGQYFVAADTTVSGGDEPFSLSIDILQPQCVPGTTGTCLDANTLQYCDSNGLFDEYTCTNGCVGTACDIPTGDSCFEPNVIAAPGGQFTGDFGGTNSVDYGDTPAGGCFTDVGDAPDGGDTIYAVDLQPGDTVTADLQTSYATAYLYISTDCADRNSCVVNNPAQGATTLSYQATTAERVFLIVDASSTSSTQTYTLDVSITQGLFCAPNTWACDAGSAKLCDDTGSAFAAQTSCAAGCANGFCEPLAEADVCATAPDASNGVRVVGNFASLTNDVDLPTTSCVGDDTPGGDLIYAVTAQVDDIIRARTVGYGGEETAVYIFSDCAAASSTCVAGDEGLSSEGFTAEALFRVRTAGTYYVAADATAGTADEPFALEIDILAPECTQGQTRCNADGVTLEYCDLNGLFADYTCGTACAADSCTMPDGSSCLEAIPITANATQSGNFGGTNSVDYGQGSFGACFTDSSQNNDGGDTIYAVELDAGETVTATLTTSATTAYLFVMEDCLDPASCAANNPGRGSTTLSYRADVAKTIYVVADATTLSSTSTYTLDFAFQSGLTCAPNMWACDAGDAKLCDASGTGFARVTDCTGGCDKGFCEFDATAADTCGTAPVVSTGTRIKGEFGGPSDTASLSAGSCTGGTTPSGEYIFAVQANAGDVIRADIQSYGLESTALYVFDDCVSPERSCYEGARYQSAEGYGGTLEFQAPTTGTYYVAADGTSSANDEPFTLVLDVGPGSCTVGGTQCSGATLQYCDNGSFTDHACSTTCTGSACDAPTGDICYDAIPVASTGSYPGTYSGKANSVNPGNGSCEWTSANRPDGPDTVYAVTLAAGDILTANLATTQGGASIYVLDSCDSPTQSCVWAEPDSTQLQYFAQVPGTYYVVVDTDFTSATATYTLDLTTTSGGVCQPDEVTCDSNTGTITECSSDGLSILGTTVCAEGCSPVGRCTGPALANDTCADAYAITAPVSLIDSYSRFNDNVDPGTGSCLGEIADGPDAIYSISLNANDVLIASVQSTNSSDDAALYLVTDCNNPGTTCLDGEVSSTASAEVAYLSPTAQQVFLVVDSDSEFDVDDFLLDIDFGPAQCSVGQTQCADANTLEYCNSLGRFDSLTCVGGCLSGACGTPQGQICADAPVVTNGTVISDGFDGSNDIDLGGGVIGSCDFSTGSSVGIGDDHFYAVDLTVGQTLTVSYTSPGQSGLSSSSYGFVFVMSDCYDGQTCLANITRVNASSTGTLTFTPTTSGRYYVVVDRALESSTSSGYGYTVTFGIQ